MVDEKLLYNTKSVCPICLKPIAAARVSRGKKIFLKKTCSEHGTFETIIWRGHYDINKWINIDEPELPEGLQCPTGCGLCADHLNSTCCVVLNITDRCNLDCNFCFADPENGANDPSFDEIKKSLYNLVSKGKSLVQLSGGEPTVRKDLVEIVRTAKQAGAKYVQLNTNGVLLGEDKKLVKDLAEAGLSFVFLQFDGTEDAIYEKLRNKPLLSVKQKAIENCAEFNIGVTLVATLVRDVNVSNIGQIINYAIERIPHVRGVHFQPVSFFGRIPRMPSNNDRITIDELIYEIESQSKNIIKAENLLPSSCYHPLCSFHGDFVIHNGSVVPLQNFHKLEKEPNPTVNPADRNREFIGRRWERPASIKTDAFKPIVLKSASPQNTPKPCCGNIHDMDYFLKIAKSQSFTITSMLFQDAGNIDFSRLRKCSLHVYDNEKFIPFCSYYLSGWEQ
ncbi:MAG: radical SAM protein [Tenuifilaceae bacterium]|nr:radical SAM protein [Tenuifilaceae bacterium]